MKAKKWLFRTLLCALALLPILYTASFIQGQASSVEYVGIRPFIRLIGREAGGQTFEIREIAGTLSLANVSTGVSQTPEGVLSSGGGGTTGCTGNNTADTVLSYNIPAGHLSANTKGVSIEAWGTTAANANNKTVILTVGGTNLVSSGVIALNNKDWRVTGTYLRTGAATEDAVGVYQNATPTTVGPTASAPADDTTAAILVKVTGTCATAANDVVGRGLVVKAIN